MIRTFFSVAIVICAAAVGISLSARLTKRIRTLERFRELLSHARTRLRYSSAPLSVVFSDKIFHFSFREHENFCDQWREFVKGFQQILQNDEIDLLIALTDGLGEGDLASQIEQIDLYDTMLGECILRVRKDCDEKAKLYRTLSFSAGLIIALLLI